MNNSTHQIKDRVDCFSHWMRNETILIILDRLWVTTLNKFVKGTGKT